MHAVSDELDQLKQIFKLSTSCATCIKDNIECEHLTSSFYGKIRDLTKKRTLKPFILVISLFFLMQFSGMIVMRPYLVPILNAYGISLNANLITAIIGLLVVIANIFIIISVGFFGKRKLYLCSMAVNVIGCFGLSKIE